VRTAPDSDIDRDHIPEVLAWAARELVGAALREAHIGRRLS
jgi:hypothetical protein